MKVKRVFLLVLDGVGVGELPDAALYGDQGSNTLGNTARITGGFRIPNLEAAGLGKLSSLLGVSAELDQGVYGKLAELASGKDTTTGHWEMTGIILKEAFPTFPQGFPVELIKTFTDLTGRGVLGNKTASGTEIIIELGAEHLRTGALIVYTSADSVFQIAAHEGLIPIAEQYRYAELARGMLINEYAVARVISRPFAGEPGAFYRTPNRKDFSLPPPGLTILDRIKAAGYTVYGVGKIDDIFCQQGLTDSNHTHNNQETLAFLTQLIKEDFQGLVFANCIDFDMLYGHRNDPQGFKMALEEVDRWLGENIPQLNSDDLLLITGDHGNDPTTLGTDHSREYIPLLVFGNDLVENVNLGVRQTFADIAASLADWFGLTPWPVGKSFAGLVKKKD